MTEVHPAGNVFQVGNGMQRSFRHDGANAKRNAWRGVAYGSSSFRMMGI